MYTLIQLKKNDNNNDKLQYLPKSLISQKYLKYSPAKYALLLYLVVSIRSVSIIFDALLLQVPCPTISTACMSSPILHMSCPMQLVLDHMQFKKGKVEVEFSHDPSVKVLFQQNRSFSKIKRSFISKSLKNLFVQ